MSFSAPKLHSVYLWLLVALGRLGGAQDVSNNSDLKSVHVPTQGFLTTISTPVTTIMPEYIRFRRATLKVVTNSCLAPPQPANGEWKLHRDDCEVDMDCTVFEGTALPPGSQLIYSCNSRYKRNENVAVFCRSKGTWSALPVCNEVKCSSLQSESTAVTCSSPLGDWVNCDSSTTSGTKAEVACRSGYAKETGFTTRRTNVVCSVNGTWQPDPIRCVPVCGRAVPHLTPLVIGGTTASVSEFPWHASLHVQNFMRTMNKTVLQYICGATIIRTNFLLTAAHCVYDERTQTLHNPGKFFVITGNIFRDYDYHSHNLDVVRRSKVKRVYSYCTYTGLTGNYGADIALLELQQPFELSSILQPACLDDSDNSERIFESTNSIEGRIPGFGRTATETSSGILQTITVPYVPYRECIESKYPTQNDPLISSDKFCAGLKNGSVVCEGDSGGGWVIKKGGQWHIMGILNVGLAVDTSNGDKACSKDSYSLYIRVSTYMPWIKDVLYYAENEKQYPSCRRSPSSCSAPPQPANGEWKLHRDSCVGDIDCKVSEGTLLKEHRQLTYSCAAGFEVQGSIYVTCKWDRQWTPIPICIPVSATSCNTVNGTQELSGQDPQDPNCKFDEHQPNMTTTTSLPVHEITRQGDSCTSTNGSPGICTLLKKCQPVLEDLKAGRLLGNHCGLFGFEPIVCCPIKKSVNTTTPLPDDLMDDGRGVIARQKCTEYSQYVNDMRCSPVVAENRLPVFTWKQTGKRRAETMEFPHMVALGYGTNISDIWWGCGGTLISETFVLSSAHCTHSKSYGTATWVRIGDTKLVRSDDGATPEVRRIVERIHHPEYRLPAFYHDIALVRLETRVPFNGWIRPACLHTAPYTGTDRAVATGWGKLDWSEFRRPNDLHKVTLPLVDSRTCSMNWTSIRKTEHEKLAYGVIADWMICAGSVGRDTCKGDSGGPLFIPSQQKYHCMFDVIGVASVGPNICGSGFPTVFTRVYHYVPWIESIVWGKG